MKQMIRHTTATRSKVVNIKRLINCMRGVKVMRLDNVMVLLRFSESGARKYTQKLVEDDVFQIHGFDPAPPKCRVGKTIYRLNLDAAFVDAYLLKLDALPTNLTERRTLVDYTGKSRLQKVQAEDGRQVHMLVDDVEHKPRTDRFKIPEHEPLMAYFFGMVAA